MNLEAFKECKTSSFLAHPQLFGNNSLQTKVFKESTSGLPPQNKKFTFIFFYQIMAFHGLFFFIFVFSIKLTKI